MTWYFDPSGTTMDVYDHTGTMIAQDRLIPETDESGEGNWMGDYPDEVLVVMRESMDGDQPSAYDQSLLADAATENIEEGMP